MLCFAFIASGRAVAFADRHPFCPALDEAVRVKGLPESKAIDAPDAAAQMSRLVDNGALRLAGVQQLKCPQWPGAVLARSMTPSQNP